jgi:hypothetical protein
VRTVTAITSLVGPSPNFSRQAAMEGMRMRLELALLRMADGNLVSHGGPSRQVVSVGGDNRSCGAR